MKLAFFKSHLSQITGCAHAPLTLSSLTEQRVEACVTVNILATALMDPRGAYVAPLYLFIYLFILGLLQKRGSVGDNKTGLDCKEAFPATKKKKRKQYLLLAENRSVHDWRENLLTLLPPYISLVSLSHVRDGWAHTCPIGARAKQLYL